MSYSFEYDVINRLPEPSAYKRMYSVSETETHIEVLEDGILKIYPMLKKDVRELFKHPVTVTVVNGMTYNDVYSYISDRYSLGWVINIDYYDNTIIDLKASIRTVETFNILKDSFGYRGYLDVIMIDAERSIPNDLYVKDLRSSNLSIYLSDIKLKTLISSKIFSLENGKLFSGKMLSLDFKSIILDYLIENMEEFLAYDWIERIYTAPITDMFNDGLSDIVTLYLSNRNILFLRFKSLPGDLPELSDIPEEIEIDPPIDVDLPDEDGITIDL